MELVEAVNLKTGLVEAVEVKKDGLYDLLGNKLKNYVERTQYDNMKNIEDLKIGELFKLKKESNIVYVRSEYNRFEKKYEAYKYEDINSFTYKKKGTKVVTDFEY